MRQAANPAENKKEPGTQNVARLRKGRCPRAGNCSHSGSRQFSPRTIPEQAVALLRHTPENAFCYLDYSFAVPLCQEAADLSHNYAVQNIVDKFLISSYDMHNFITSGLA
jgi:hypothetical protein